MELLLFWKDHWMDALTPQEVADRVALNPKFQNKYDARYQRGDVVEVREDGYWDTRGFDHDSFCVVQVPGMALDKTKMAALVDDPEAEHPVILKRREWHFPQARIPAAILSQINSSKKVKITLSNFQSLDVLTRAQRSAFISDTAKLVSKGG